MKPTLLFLLAACLFSIPSNAQFRCGFDAALGKRGISDSLYRREILQMNEQLRSIIEQQKVQKGSEVLSPIYNIPVVIHVIHTGGAVGTSYNPSVAQITGALEYLNEVYDGSYNDDGIGIAGVGDLNIKFILATKDPNNNPTTGINRVNGSSVPNYTSQGMRLTTGIGADELTIKNLSRWDPYKYYNIWLVNKIDNCDGIAGCPSFIAGFAYFPFSNSSAGTRDLDGTVMLASQMYAGQKTLPHEVGHALNLYHPFEGELEQVGVNGCPPLNAAAGDQCADTNPITNPADDGATSPFSCRTGISACYGLAYNDRTERNFMNYTSCYNQFTLDQRSRMHASATSTMRSSLVTSWTNNEHGYPTTWVAPGAPLVTPASELEVANVAGIMKLSIAGIDFHSLNSTQEGGYVNRADRWYNLIPLSRNTLYTVNLSVLGAYNEQIGVWIDYDGNGIFNNTNERVFYQDNIPLGTTIPISFTTPSALSGSIVRMRIVEDLGTMWGSSSFINGPTVALTYGQTEDYPVFLQSGVLPLQLLAFEGTRSAQKVSLLWRTAGEYNTDRFEVQRSTDGLNYDYAGTVKATSQPGEHGYNFTDAAPGTSRLAYRLKMFDKDGKFTFSKVIPFDSEDYQVLVGNNPFSDQLTIQLPGNVEGVQVLVSDIAGRRLYQNEVSFQSKLSISTSAWQAGIYLLSTTVNGKKEVRKLIKK